VLELVPLCKRFIPCMSRRIIAAINPESAESPFHHTEFFSSTAHDSPRGITER
jgi:hypothetical protein